MSVELSEAGKKALETLSNELNQDFSWATTTGYGINCELKWSEKSSRACISDQEIISLNLNGMGLTSLPKSVSHENFPNLKGLNLRNNKLEQVDLDEIAFMTTLEFLDIGKNSLSEIDLMKLKELKYLKVIGLQENSLTRLDLEPLKELQQLERLYLGGNFLHELDLEPLTHTLKLVELDLSSNQMHYADFTHLHNLEKLYWLYLTDNNYSEDIIKQTDELKMNGAWVFV